MSIKNFVIFIISFLVVFTSFELGKTKINSSLFGDIKARNIGPAVMSGRITDIAVVESDINIIYVGTAGGGVWKSKSGGITFKPVFDKFTMAIGCVTIDPKNPDIVWVGTGETNMRNSVSIGTGIYKTVDGGKSWKHMGLSDSERISEILVDPRNSDVVYAAVPGHLWDANTERGLYKTIDGGKNWEKLFYIDQDTGCIDVDMDPKNPDLLIAAMWKFRREPDFFSAGSYKSGMYKSLNGGKSWKRLKKGLPKGKQGRIVVDFHLADPKIVYALVESEKTFIYRSDDSGETWVKKGTGFGVKARPFYLAGLKVDPKDPDRIYNYSFMLSVSKNAGQSFESAMENFMGMTVHPDQHALWIDPKNPKHLFLATDGGVYISYDRGGKFRHVSNLPVSQFYHVSYDLRDPYNVYGGLQDNNSWYGPSKMLNAGQIRNKDWVAVGGGDGFYVFRDPSDNDIVYYSWQGGMFQRFNEKTGETASIKPLPSENEPDYRFNWNAGMELSPNNKKRLYVGSQFLFVSHNQGNSWKKISGDLTTNDKSKQRQSDSGGITPDNTTAENHCSIIAISESPVNEKVIWVGTDDGNLQVTRNGGKKWSNVIKNIKGLPKATWCPAIEAGNYEEGTAYVVFDGHRTGDKKTYIYRTVDFGKTWESIVTDEVEGYAHIIKEDIKNKDLLFLGTEFGLYISFNRGKNWVHFKETLPRVGVRDIQIHPVTHDLILGTHGRGIYIIDDITPLRSINDETLEQKVAILPASPSETSLSGGGGAMTGDTEYFGENPSEGATITYYLKKRHIFGEFKLEIFDSNDKLIKVLPTGKRKGINRVYWGMRMKAPKAGRAPGLTGFVFGGPMVDPGEYKIKLTKNKKVYESTILLKPNHYTKHSLEDTMLRQEKVWEVYHMLEHMAYFSDTLSDIVKELEKKLEIEKLPNGVKKIIKRGISRARLIKSAIIDEKGSIYSSEMLQGKMIQIYSAVSMYGGKPTDSQLTYIRTLKIQLNEIEKKFGSFIKKDMVRINRFLNNYKAGGLNIISEKEYKEKNKD